MRRAREMSFTGNFMLAEEALQFGLVNHVVAHAELIPFTRQLATDIIGNDQHGVRQIRATYAGDHRRRRPAGRSRRDDGAGVAQRDVQPDKVAERRGRDPGPRPPAVAPRRRQRRLDQVGQRRAAGRRSVAR